MKERLATEDTEGTERRFIALFCLLCVLCALCGNKRAASALAQQSMPSQPPPFLSVPSSSSVVRSEEILEAEQFLSDLGYWTGPVDGVMDGGSRYALVAFQKVEGRKPTGKLTPEELQALRTASRPLSLESGYPHVEVDLNRQVLFFVDSEGIVSKILPVSSGNGKLFTEGGRTRRAYTVRGRFTVYRKLKGWRKSPLGLLYYPNYYAGGDAIHGNPSVPVYPASHGCIRIPMFAAKEFSKLTPVGTIVIVHDGVLRL